MTWEVVNKSRIWSLSSIGVSTASLMLCATIVHDHDVFFFSPTQVGFSLKQMGFSPVSKHSGRHCMRPSSQPETKARMNLCIQFPWHTTSNSKIHLEMDHENNNTFILCLMWTPSNRWTRIVLFYSNFKRKFKKLLFKCVQNKVETYRHVTSKALGEKDCVLENNLPISAPGSSVELMYARRQSEKRDNSRLQKNSAMQQHGHGHLFNVRQREN